jgi:hypothetical protein
MMHVSPVESQSPFSIRPYFFNECRQTHWEMSVALGRTRGVFSRIALVVMFTLPFLIHFFADLVCMAINWGYRWKALPIAQQNTQALMGPLTKDPTELILAFLPSEDVAKFDLTPAQQNLAELKTPIEQSGKIQWVQYEKFIQLNALCTQQNLNPIALNERLVTDLDLSQSAITDEQLDEIVRQFPSRTKIHLKGCANLSQAAVQRVIEQANVSKIESLFLPTFFLKDPNGHFVRQASLTNQLAEALCTHVGNSLRSISFDYSFPEETPFRKLLQSCHQQLSSFSLKGMREQTRVLEELSHCPLENLSLEYCMRSGAPLNSIFQNCPLKHLRLSATLLPPQAIQTLAIHRGNGLETLELDRMQSSDTAAEDITALSTHCHNLRSLLMDGTLFAGLNGVLLADELKTLITNNPHLKSLQLGPFHKHVDPAELAALRPGLEYFSISGYSIWDIEPHDTVRKIIEHCPGIKRIGKGGMSRAALYTLREQYPRIEFDFSPTH